jgi:hypothetical protein
MRVMSLYPSRRAHRRGQRRTARRYRPTAGPVHEAGLVTLARQESKRRRVDRNCAMWHVTIQVSAWNVDGRTCDITARANNTRVSVAADTDALARVRGDQLMRTRGPTVRRRGHSSRPRSGQPSTPTWPSPCSPNDRPPAGRRPGADRASGACLAPRVDRRCRLRPHLSPPWRACPCVWAIAPRHRRSD